MSSWRNKIVYCSWSPYKIEEWNCVKHSHEIAGRSGISLEQLIDVEFRQVSTDEPLLRDLEQMVHHKAISAYTHVKVPCIVEHAGLILAGYEEDSYPGGLTQPMWDALGAEKFVATCRPLADRATARAVIGYCDGAVVKTFVGEMGGTLTSEPKGDRQFYWDTVFCPDGFGGQTYAQIVSADPDGLAKKLQVSQSIKALKMMIAYQLNHSPFLFPGL